MNLTKQTKSLFNPGLLTCKDKTQKENDLISWMISLVNHSYVKAKGGYANNLLFHTKVTVRRDHVPTVTTKPP